MANAKPRGERNNNPGNIRHSAAKWQGQAKEQADPAFVTFTSPQFGIRALVRTLLTYSTTHGLTTVRGIIGRWAPPNENDTGAYVAAVARAVGVGADAKLDVDTLGVMLPLVTGIITHENGRQPYPQATLVEGLRLAGISDAKPKPFLSKARVQAAVGTTASSGVAAFGLLQGGAQTVVDHGRAYSDLSPIVAKTVAFAAGAAFLFGIGVLGLQYVQHRSVGI